MNYTRSTPRRHLRLGVVGCGWAGQQAVQAANLVPRTTVLAVADMDEERRTHTVETHKVERTYRDYRELLADGDIDAVYLATNPQVRTPMAIDSFRAGKHTLVQKPHALRAADIRRIEREAVKSGRVLQFCFFMRHFRNYRKLRQQLVEGAIGQIYHARVCVQYNEDMTHSDRDYWLYAYGRMGGALAQHASHELDLAWWCMGCPRPLWAFAARHSPYCKYGGPEGPAEDWLSGIVGFDGGRTIQVEATRMSHVNVGRVFQLFGKDGAVNGTAISRFHRGEYKTREVVKPVDRRRGSDVLFFYEIEDFAKAVAGEIEPDVNADDAYVFTKMLQALYASARRNRRVAIQV